MEALLPCLAGGHQLPWLSPLRRWDPGELQGVRADFKVCMQFPYMLQRVLHTPGWQKTPMACVQGFRFSFRSVFDGGFYHHHDPLNESKP